MLWASIAVWSLVVGGAVAQQQQRPREDLTDYLGRALGYEARCARKTFGS